MENVMPMPRLPSLAEFRELVLPKEHGSWSLALEPLAFGLVAAPSAAGAWFAMAVAAAFFARRPLRIAWRETRRERRSAALGALLVCVGAAVLAFSIAVALAGAAWLAWLLPSAIAGAVFLHFDLQNAGRDEPAEIAGSAAFALLPAAVAVIAGSGAVNAGALAVVMCGRAVPTVLAVRGALRAAKTGTPRRAPALFAAALALGAGIGLWLSGAAPFIAVAALALLAARAAWLLCSGRALRARTIGMIEAALGALFVISVAACWNL